MRCHSLRLRVALNFAWFGALISLVLLVGVYVAVHDLGERLMYETLQAEMQDYLARRAINPTAMLPATLTLSGYEIGPEHPGTPAGLAGLPPGRQAIELGGARHLALVGDHDGHRYAFLFDETRQLQRERHFLYYLAGGMAIMTALSAAGGFWLARRVVAPVTDLATRVAALDRDDTRKEAAPDCPGDEVDGLAQAFDRYLGRIRECVERERTFTADVSHELRTPLAIIRGAVEVLEDDARLDPGQRQRIARIERASQDMADLTGALLHLARNGGTTGNEPESCDIADVVRESVEKHRALHEGRPVALELEIGKATPLPAERILATVVVDNLIDNALRHADSGHVRVHLEENCLVVSDSGKGIAEADIGQIFQRNYRGCGSDGAGIGLSLVKRICDLRGWRIVIDSKPGNGTTAVLFFTRA